MESTDIRVFTLQSGPPDSVSSDVPPEYSLQSEEESFFLTPVPEEGIAARRRKQAKRKQGQDTTVTEFARNGGRELRPGPLPVPPVPVVDGVCLVDELVLPRTSYVSRSSQQFLLQMLQLLLLLLWVLILISIILQEEVQQK